jgi:hypothetical protein
VNDATPTFSAPRRPEVQGHRADSRDWYMLQSQLLRDAQVLH